MAASSYAWLIQVAPLHTPDEMRQISDLAHRVVGSILGVAALVVLVQSVGYLAGRRSRYLWPGLIAVSGVFLFVYLFLPHHGLEHAREQWAFVFGVPQQRQHVILAVLAALGGVTELAYRAGYLRRRWWELAWPAALIAVGVMFATHPQHGTEAAVERATLLHRLLGILLLATGLLRGAEVLGPMRRRWLGVSWALMLLGAAGVLAIYREPEGAYDARNGAGHNDHPIRANGDSTPARQR